MLIIKQSLNYFRRALQKSEICKPVFFPSAILTVLFVVLSVVFPSQSSHVLAILQSHITNQFGWLYLLAVATFVVFCVVLTVTRYGDIKLGMDHSEPEYSYKAWFAMLFSAGMGIGAYFLWGCRADIAVCSSTCRFRCYCCCC